MSSSLAIQTAAAATYDSSSEWELSDSDSQESFQSLQNESSAHDEANTEDGEKSTPEAAEMNPKLPGVVKPLLHHRHSAAERNILMNGKAQWMGCKGAARKKVFLSILGQMRKLEEVKSLSKGDWEARERVCAILSFTHPSERWNWPDFSHTKLGCLTKPVEEPTIVVSKLAAAGPRVQLSKSKSGTRLTGSFKRSFMRSWERMAPSRCIRSRFGGSGIASAWMRRTKRR